MEIVLKNTKSKYLEIFYLLNLNNIHETFQKIFFHQGTFRGKKFSQLMSQ